MRSIEEEIVAWLRARTGAHGGGFTSADDVADALEKEFVQSRIKDKVMVDNLPVYLNLGDIHRLESLIGYAKVTRNSAGLNKIEIILDKETSTKLGNMVDVFDLKAIGFAGIKKRPVHEMES